MWKFRGEWRKICAELRGLIKVNDLAKKNHGNLVNYQTIHFAWKPFVTVGIKTRGDFNFLRKSGYFFIPRENPSYIGLWMWTLANRNAMLVQELFKVFLNNFTKFIQMQKLGKTLFTEFWKSLTKYDQHVQLWWESANFNTALVHISRSSEINCYV